MSYKTILASLNEISQLDCILRAATSIAKKEGAHIVGLYVIPGIELKLASEIETLPIEDDTLQKHYRQQEKSVRSTFEGAVKEAGVQGEFQVQVAPWPHISKTVVEEARQADLVIVGYSSSESNRALGAGFSEEVLFGSGRPTLVMPPTGRSGFPIDRIMIGWNGSREATRAIFDAIPLLKQADDILIAAEESDALGETRMDARKNALIRTLLRQGIKARIIGLDGSHDVGEALLTKVESRRADLLVMGAYGHARLREFLLGGATRSVLKGMKCSVLFSH